MVSFVLSLRYARSIAALTLVPGVPGVVQGVVLSCGQNWCSFGHGTPSGVWFPQTSEVVLL
jgi:hypothetical protein